MGLFLVFTVIFIAGYIYWIKKNKFNSIERKKSLFKSIFYFLIIISIGLALSGRVSWIIAAGAALIPIVKFLFLFLWKSIPLIQMWLRSRGTRAGKIFSSENNNELTQTEALEILGLEPEPSDEEIIQAHRELIQKFHPDRGGNNYMATKLNLARDLLLRKKS